MADRFLSPPFRSGHQSGRNDARILRDRQAAQSRAADRAQGRQAPFSSARQLVQVYDGGAMGAAAELYYFTHPVLATGAETEGGTATLTTDTATTVPVVFLGHAPSAGDYVTAYSVGGRWVTEHLTAPIVGGCYLSGCSPCPIPFDDLTITTSIGCVGFTITTATLTWNGNRTAPEWSYCSPPCGFFGGVFDEVVGLTLTCTSLGTFLYRTFSAPTCIPITGLTPIALSSHNCSPLSLVFGGGEYTITGPADPPACPVCFQVTGCGGGPVAGATVSISGGASGTTEAFGIVILDVGTAGTYTVGVTYSPAPRFDSFSQSMTVTCGQSVTIPLVTASGYHCSCLGALPLADTLTLSTSAGGGTLTWNAVGVSPCLVGFRWSGGSGTLPFSEVGCTATTVSGPFEFATGIICAPSLTYSFDLSTGCPAASSSCNSLLPWNGGTRTGTLEPLNLTWTNGANTATLTE